MTGSNQISLKEIVGSLINAPWSGDPFQTPMVLNTLCSLKAVDCNTDKFTKAAEDLLSQSELNFWPYLVIGCICHFLCFYFVSMRLHSIIPTYIFFLFLFLFLNNVFRGSSFETS